MQNVFMKLNFFLVLEENDYQVCLTAEAESFMPMKRDIKQCTGQSFNYWSLYEESLIRNAGNGLCIGFDTPEEMAKLEFLRCNATDKRQIWKFQSDDFSLRMHHFPYHVWFGYSSAHEVVATNHSNLLSKWMLFDPVKMLKSSFYGTIHNGNCPTLKDLPNGLWYPASCRQKPSQDGTMCVFACTQGYGKVNDLTMVRATCRSGIWKGLRQPSCFQSCSAFASLKNAKVSPVECSAKNFVERGTICTFSCSPSYVLIGERSTACLTRGQWSALQPKCVRYCPPISAPTHGQISPSKTCQYPTDMQAVNSTCKIVCDKGFVLSGSNNVKCLENGIWNETGASCVRACEKPKPPSMGYVNCHFDQSFYPVSTSCNYYCYDGRTLHPNVQVITCLSSGTWDNYPPTCQNFCPTLFPLNHGVIKPSLCTEQGKFLPNLFQCSFSCNLTYTLKGEKDLTCLVSGKWSSAPPVCNSDTQFLLVHESKTVPIICLIAEEYSYYDKYHVSVLPYAQCNSWNPLHIWTLSSLNRIQNIATGWCLSATVAKEEERLVLSKCSNTNHQQWKSILNDQFAAIQLDQSDMYLQYQNNYVYASKNYVNPEDISWTTYSLADMHGTLTGMKSSGEGTCPLLSPLAGTRIFPSSCLSSVAVGTLCKITCADGFQLKSGSSSSASYCDKYGLWSTLDIYCKIRYCPPLPVPPTNTFIDKASCYTTSLQAFSNQSCNYSCAIGFYLELRGGATGVLHCLGNGKWSEPISKCFQYCRPLHVAEKGTVLPKKSCTKANEAKHGQMCTFSCNPHFYLKGPQFLRCNFGKWNGTEPTCIEISGSGRCKGFPSVDNAKLFPGICYNALATVPRGTVCHIACKAGYSAVPTTYNSTVCQANGKWSLALPNCKKTCPLFSAPLHSFLEPEACENGVITEGEACNVICQRSYALTSSGKVTCLSTGSWDNMRATCETKPQFMIQNSNECAYPANDGKSWIYFKTCSQDDLSQWLGMD